MSLIMSTGNAWSINPAEYGSKNIDHFGIVAEVCREIGLAEEIDRVLGVDPRQKVTYGEGAMALL